MHLSARESVDLLLRAARLRRRGERGGDAAPPLPHRRGSPVARSEPEDESRRSGPSDDRAALIEALRDGTIAAVATDHAPHSREEKDVPFEAAPFGVTGLETAFAALYTNLVEPGLVTSLERCSSGCPRGRRASSGSTVRGSRSARRRTSS